MIYFVIGGARSGKSGYAAKLAATLAKQQTAEVLNIATAQAFDDEMSDRIKKHQQDRPAHWQLAEVPLELTEYLTKVSQNKKVILIDCLTLWLNNQLFEKPAQNFETCFKQLSHILLSLSCDVILVANEVGLGVIPSGEISRKFVDEAGRLNQLMAQIAHDVVFMAAGLPLQLKGKPQ
ncbi:bifunctional adenosylcobinamide kinase/adenosylcobinamide-phosphate guanylyltransferase [Catenovulum sp. 2E275]|uniref:bifunctional adenosylcobinamide kinase/adenosylcobinamide-phosphate guanylyltransferase n=1 Tax=Catenovulum sp. 2E275 TaxID=2980497 RepID=UPI0021D1932B|nr:bifunctional adenosylcobinamide kinase/adenosylcobinamide-phosphate guanylyltransferase [Catenovulum sp. 2E275]MCU4674649.1 bifunctional adenosylcobinamide kinase/adenosylcobinamide-phosphate guanylyltransferase [Catenovulum sp. 2E275]